MSTLLYYLAGTLSSAILVLSVVKLLRPTEAILTWVILAGCSLLALLGLLQGYAALVLRPFLARWAASEGLHLLEIQNGGEDKPAGWDPPGRFIQHLRFTARDGQGLTVGGWIELLDYVVLPIRTILQVHLERPKSGLGH